MKSISGKALCKIVERQGWQLKRITGSHHIYAKEGLAVILEKRNRVSVVLIRVNCFFHKRNPVSEPPQLTSGGEKKPGFCGANYR
jgi:predicted RNA binding protein YcfA (HicA-like mRNA interferase family)